MGCKSETPTTTTSRKVSQYTSQFVFQYAPKFVLQYFWCPYTLRKWKSCQYSSHLYRSTPPICIAIRLPFVSQHFWENLGGCGHQDAPQFESLSSRIVQFGKRVSFCVVLGCLQGAKAHILVRYDEARRWRKTSMRCESCDFKLQ